MKYSNFTIAFALLFFAVAILTTITLTQGTEAQSQSIIIENQVSSSCKSAMKRADISKSNVFEKEEIRKNVCNQFYDSLGGQFKRMNNDTLEYQIRFEVPCLILFDNDGLYVNYMHFGKNKMYKAITTPKQSYSEIVGPKNIQLTYCLDGTIKYMVEILNEKTGQYETKKGKLQNFTQMQHFAETYNGVDFLKSKTKIRERQIELMAKVLQDTIEYYVNTQPKENNRHNISYDINVAAVDDYLMEALDEPNVVAFYQGKQNRSKYSRTNVYSLISYNLDQKTKYQTYSDGYYHKPLCKYKTGTWEGAYTKEDAAKRGYSPCPHCIMK